MNQAQSALQDIENLNMKKVYVAGPMSGYEDFNRPAFFAMADQLKAAGFVVLNPAILPDGMTQAEYMQIDMAMVMVADTLVMLEGWQHSPGAVAEYHLAYKMGKAIVMETQVPDRMLMTAA